MTGFVSKRQAAQAKLDNDTQVYGDALTIAYQSGYYDGKKAAQLVQEPVEDVVEYFADGTRIVRIAPQRPWVGLTEWEREAIAHACGAMGAEWLMFIEAVEKALKEKNR